MALEAALGNHCFDSFVVSLFKKNVAVFLQERLQLLGFGKGNDEHCQQRLLHKFLQSFE